MSGSGGEGAAGGTFDAQKDLPPLPLPSLEETMAKILESAKVFQDADAQAHTEAVARDFMEGVGPSLQKMLEDRADGSRNWLEEWWERFVYLMPRSPTAVLINWWGVIPGTWGPDSARITQSLAAALMVQHTCKIRQSILDGSYPLETMAGQPLCMHQFSRVFNTCRVAGEGEDELRVWPMRETPLSGAASSGESKWGPSWEEALIGEDVERPTSRHIAVLIGGAVFSFDVIDAEGTPLPALDIWARFEEVLHQGKSAFDLGQEPHVSMLTCQERDVWAKARDHLRREPRNAASLETIESSLFVVSLEEGAEPVLEDRARRNLTGNGGRGRWFDKPFTLVIYEDGTGGINGEHSWADAMVIVSVFDRILGSLIKEMESVGLPLPPDSAPRLSPGTVRKLEWELDPKSIQNLEMASSHGARLDARADLKVLVFPHFGKSFLKRHRLIPDSFLQMAIQLAYWRLHRRVVATYESAHTRFFYHGRTETIRTTCAETVAFCLSMDGLVEDGDVVPEASAFSAPPGSAADAEDGGAAGGGGATESLNARRFRLLQEALVAHKKRGKDALLGRGIDRHFLGLYVASEMMGVSPRPALFSDPGVTKSRTYTLSTSNISMKESTMMGGFFPITKDGYGVCYSIQGHQLKFSICSDAACADTSADAFRTKLVEALMDMQAVVTARDTVFTGPPQ